MKPTRQQDSSSVMRRSTTTVGSAAPGASSSREASTAAGASSSLGAALLFAATSVKTYMTASRKAARKMATQPIAKVTGPSLSSSDVSVPSRTMMAWPPTIITMPAHWRGRSPFRRKHMRSHATQMVTAAKMTMKMPDPVCMSP